MRRLEARLGRGALGRAAAALLAGLCLLGGSAWAAQGGKCTKADADAFVQSHGK